MSRKHPVDAGLDGSGVDGVTLNPSVDPEAPPAVTGAPQDPPADPSVDQPPEAPVADPDAPPADPPAPPTDPDLPPAEAPPEPEPDPSLTFPPPCFAWTEANGSRWPVLNGEIVVDQAEREGITCLVTTGGRKIFLCTISEYEAVYGKLIPDVRAQIAARYPNAA